MDDAGERWPLLFDPLDQLGNCRRIGDITGQWRDFDAAGPQRLHRLSCIRGVGATPAETMKFLQSEVEKWEKVINAAGVKIDS